MRFRADGTPRRDARRRRAAVVVALAAVAGAVLAACGTTSTLPDGTLPPLGTGTYPPPTTVVAPAPSTAAVSTTVEPGLPATTSPSTSNSGWRGWDHDDVPPLGSESVRGTGCGSTGGIGEQVPDGVWNVLIGDGTGGDAFWTAEAMTVDMRCIYTGVGGEQLWNAACLADPQSQSCVNQTPDWYVVNANGRLRTVPVAPDVRYGVGALGTSPCPSVPADRTASNAPWRTLDSWIVVQGGRVTDVVTACPR